MVSGVLAKKFNFCSNERKRFTCRVSKVSSNALLSVPSGITITLFVFSNGISDISNLRRF